MKTPVDYKTLEVKRLITTDEIYCMCGRGKNCAYYGVKRKIIWQHARPLGKLIIENYEKLD